MAEEKYVLKHVYEADKGAIYRKINEEKSDTNARIGDLVKLVHVFIESQKPFHEGFRDLKGELVTLNAGMADFKEIITDHNTRLNSIEASVEAKSKHNTAIWVAFIGGGFALLGTALGLAQYLF